MSEPTDTSDKGGFQTPGGLRDVGYSPMYEYMKAAGTWPAGLQHTNFGVAFGLPLPPSTFASVPFNQTYGGQRAPYDDLTAQTLDAMQLPTRYTQSWPWDNGARRYDFARQGQSLAPPPAGLATGVPNGAPYAPSAAPPGLQKFGPTGMPRPSTGGGLPISGMPGYPGAGLLGPANNSGTGGDIAGNGVYTPPAPPRNPDFGPTGPYAAAPGPAPTSLMPTNARLANNGPTYNTPSNTDAALAFAQRKYGNLPQSRQDTIRRMTSTGPAVLSEWNALGDDAARGYFLNTHPRFAQDLLSSGNLSHERSAYYSLMAPGYQG